MPESQTYPTPPSEAFRNVPNAAESFGNLPQPAEAFGTIRNGAGAFGNVPMTTEQKDNHTLTVREVARRFETAGVARTERSIVNWCQPGKQGVARLDAYYDPNERRYFITPESVDLAIAEEQAKAAQRGSTPESSGTLPSPAETIPNTSEPEANDGDKAELKREVLDLKIANRAKDMFIDQLKEERTAFAEERRDYVEKLMTFNRKVGELETKLLQLEGPEGRGSPEQTS